MAIDVEEKEKEKEEEEEEEEKEEPQQQEAAKRSNGKYEVCLRKGRLDMRKLRDPKVYSRKKTAVESEAEAEAGAGLEPDRDAGLQSESESDSYSQTQTHSHSNAGLRQVSENEIQGVGGGRSDITCVQLTVDFLIFGTQSGSLQYHYLDDVAGPCFATEYNHCEGGINRIWPSKVGTRLLFEDNRHCIYLYNPFRDQATPVLADGAKVDAALWDASDSVVFILSTANRFFIYLYSPVNIFNSRVSLLQESTLSPGLRPVVLQSGTLTCKQDDGVLQTITLPTHKWLKKSITGAEEIQERFRQHLVLLHFQEALEDAKLLNCPMAWKALKAKALEEMELEVAIMACQYSADIKVMVSLRRVEKLEEYNLVAGHVMVLLENFDGAQEYFLKSTYPHAAVEMRRDLEHWAEANTLAKDLNSPLQAEIKKGYAHSLELKEDYRQALSIYEEFLKSSPGPSQQEQKSFCQAGVARTSIHLGDIWKGKQLAKDCNNSVLYRECAAILEGLNLHQDAAELYELDGQLEKAVSIYISAKNYSKAASLLERIRSPKFYIMYATALEKERRFAEAAAAYEVAEDHKNAVRLHLGPLKSPNAAFDIVRQTRSIEGASMAYKYCKNIGDYGNAVEFLVLQKRTQEARELAQQQDKMDIYTEKVADVAPKDECLKLARYYEAIGNPEKAAKMFERCDESKQALRLYLSWGTVTAIEQAIELVGRMKDQVLTIQLLDFLMGEKEGMDKNPEYLFKLHTVLGNYDLATKAALLAAQREQEKGNYKVAHQHLFHLCKLLNTQQKPVPYEMSKQLLLLHSYTLVKTRIRLGDHRSSARLLIRVARHISTFPAHVIPILIATVIECQRSGLKKTAFEYASILMRPEYRNQITSTYKRKIESIVRKPERIEEDEKLSPCPFCQQHVPETQLECPTCRNYLPYCIASGRHMVLGNWTMCPSCQFPALLTELTKVIEVEKVCPMCWTEVNAHEIVEIADPIKDMKLEDAGVNEALTRIQLPEQDQ